MSKRVTYEWKNHPINGWSYSISVDGRVFMRSSPHASQDAMQENLERDLAAVKTSVSLEEAAKLQQESGQRAVLVVAESHDLAMDSLEFVARRLKLSPQIAAVPVLLFGKLPQEYRVVGVCFIGLHFNDPAVMKWAASHFNGLDSSVLSHLGSTGNVPATSILEG